VLRALAFSTISCAASLVLFLSRTSKGDGDDDDDDDDDEEEKEEKLCITSST